MKPHSCLYRATADLMFQEFGVEITPEPFDKYHNGEGVPAILAITAINEALHKTGYEVEAFYGDLNDAHLLDRPDLYVKTKTVNPPLIGIKNSHAEAYFVGQEVKEPIDFAIKISLRKTGFLATLVKKLKIKLDFVMKNRENYFSH